MILLYIYYVNNNCYLSRVFKNVIMALWTVALDKEGKQINIENAHRHEKYTCINCGEPMMAKKGREREPHFSHHVVTEQCNHDTWLHKNLLSLFMERLGGQDPFGVRGPQGEIDLLNNDSFVRENKFEDWVPDILIRKGEDVLFLEICVTSPCSADKISSGYRIIEIFTTDTRVLEELSSGPILHEGKYYKVEFHNFIKAVDDDLPGVTHTHIPDVISDESERCIGSRVGKEDQEMPMPEPTLVPAARTFNGSHACYFIVHADRTFEVKEYIQVLPTDLLILGINTVPDFAMNIGRAYAWRKGIISKDVLTEYETHIDIPAVIQSFNVTEFSLGNHLI